MSDLLSQDEIDALLHGVDDVEEDEVGDADSDASTLEYDFSSQDRICLLYTSPSPRDKRQSRMPSSA